MNFVELGLARPLLKALDQLGFSEPTPIQSQAIPLVLSGRDIMGCAQTGTGKTAAFALPLINRLMQPGASSPAVGTTENGDLVAGSALSPAGDSKQGRRRKNKRKPNRPIRGLILAPTRELASQISDSLRDFCRHTPIRHTQVFGGVSQVPQVRALRRGVDILVATPGRLLDLMEQGEIRLDQIETLVLDEADQMMDMGFLPALKQIVARTPQERQTLMFSATMPAEIRELSLQWLNDPARVDVTPESTPAENIQQSVLIVSRQHKLDRLVQYLNASSGERTLVFSRTKHGADKIVTKLERQGIAAEAIHGDKTQRARQNALERFRKPNPMVLVATDIAARGLDIRNVAHVINYDMPDAPETYVHRIGRTARAGASGVAFSLCSREERKLLRQVERLLKASIPLAEGSSELEVASGDRGRQGDESNRSRGSRQRVGNRRSPGGPGNSRGSARRTRDTDNSGPHAGGKKRRPRQFNKSGKSAARASGGSHSRPDLPALAGSQLATDPNATAESKSTNESRNNKDANSKKNRAGGKRSLNRRRKPETANKAWARTVAAEEKPKPRKRRPGKRERQAARSGPGSAGKAEQKPVQYTLDWALQGDA